MFEHPNGELEMVYWASGENQLDLALDIQSQAITEAVEQDERRAA
jgi:hypothetical protein